MTKQFTIIACLVLLAFGSGCSKRLDRVTEAKALVVTGRPPVRLSAEKADAAEPAVAVGRDKSVYVAWAEHLPGGRADVFLAPLDKEGQLKGNVTRVNPNLGEAKMWHGDPPTVITAPDGAIYVGWTRAQAKGHATDICLSASRDGGRSFEAPVKVNDDQKQVAHGMHSLAMAPNGRVYVAWLDERNISAPPAEGKMKQSEMSKSSKTTKEGSAKKTHKHHEMNREVFVAFSTDGGRTFSPNQQIAKDACPCCKTSLAVDPSSRVYASWRQVLPGNLRHIAVASSKDGGNTFSSPVIVSNDQWEINGCPVSGAAMTAGGDGILRVLWYTAGEAGKPGLYSAESRDGGLTFGPRKTFASSNGRGTPVFIRSNDHVVAVWESNDGDLSILSAAQLLADGQTTTTASLIRGGELPSGAMTDEHLFVAYVSYKDNLHSIWFIQAQPVLQS
jgi:hypothetical protein